MLACQRGLILFSQISLTIIEFKVVFYFFLEETFICETDSLELRYFCVLVNKLVFIFD